ncbi:septum formation inhibitor Maf [Haloferula sp.]|uniref:septum formation inhibitor Maf n=1 Tax=Haloferula sp. TaxID=2497595 RepID=UPI00329F6315
MAFILLTISSMGLQAADLTSKSVRDYWFDGAEINRYELKQGRYGEQHPGHAEFIFVTEPFLTDKQVKHEGGPGSSVPVLKLNALRTFNTGIYSYRTMTSTFQPTDLKNHPHALKSTTSVQDWCGQAFLQLNRRKPGWSLQLNSYFQNEGDQNLKISEAILEDSVWIRMRLDPKNLPQGEFKMIPGAIFTRFQHVEVKPATAKGTLSLSKGRYHYSLNYPSLGRTLKIEADEAFPHVIREWSESHQASGTNTTAKLTHHLTKQYYWDQKRHSDAGSRRKLGLSPTPR